MNDGVLPLGKQTRDDIRLQFENARIDAISFTTTPIELNTKKVHATGFFWRSKGRTWLITNWHVVTGVNPFTGMGCKDLWPPTSIRIHDMVWLTPDAPLADSHICPERRQLDIPLYKDEKPVWLQHPRFSTDRVDLVALELPTGTAKGSKFAHGCVNECGFVKFYHHVGADAFVVGYPFSNFEGLMTPIWKRGALASEPLIPVADKPLFLLDIASSEGMSGAPVFRRTFGPAVTGNMTTQLANVVATEFVGVYAGRLESSDLTRVGIGYAWYGNLVDEIIESGCAGTTSVA